MIKYLKPKSIAYSYVGLILLSILVASILLTICGEFSFNFLSKNTAIVITLLSLIPSVIVGRKTFALLLPLWVNSSIDRTENISFLKHFLLKSKLIDKEGNFSNRIERVNKKRSKKTSKRLKSVSGFSDDLNIADEVEIKENSTNIFMIVFFTIAICSGVILKSQNILIAILVFTAGAILFVLKLKKYRNRKVILTLSKKGITIENKNLVTWEKIEKDSNGLPDIKIIKSIHGNNQVEFNYLKSQNKIETFSYIINDLDINDGRLFYLTYIYSNRNRIKQQQQNPNTLV